jgi:purine-cytosine permease-like protein
VLNRLVVFAGSEENNYLRAFVNVNLASTAEAKSGLSSTILRVRIWSKLCTTVSKSLTMAGYRRLSTCSSWAVPLDVSLELWLWDARRTEVRSRSR